MYSNDFFVNHGKNYRSPISFAPEIPGYRLRFPPANAIRDLYTEPFSLSVWLNLFEFLLLLRLALSHDEVELNVYGAPHEALLT